MNAIDAAASTYSFAPAPNRPYCRAEESRQSTREAGGRELTEQEEKQVQELKKRDTEVRAHERAHVAAGGQYCTGGARLELTRGPDGKMYAVGGEVSIDTSAVPGDPRATIRKMQVVRRAALAPAQPSGQDRAVAAQASQKEAVARQELMQERQEGTGSTSGTEPEAEMDRTNRAIAGYSGNSRPYHQIENASVINLVV